MERLVGKQAPDFCMEALSADGEHFTRVSLSDYSGKWLVLFFYPMDFTFVCPTELTAFSDRRGQFAEMGTELLSVSTDSKFCHLAWTKEGLGKLGYPMAADQTLRVSTDYGVLLEDAGVALRGLFIINPEGVVKYAVVHDNDIGRNPEEILRVLEALQSGGLCGAGWTKGQDNLHPAAPAEQPHVVASGKYPTAKIYTMPDCSYCRRTKEQLRELGVAYEEINLAVDKAGQSFMADRKYTKLPVVVIGTTEITGYDMPRIRQALGME